MIIQLENGLIITQKINVMNDKIRELQRQIKEEESKIRKCKHIFGEPYYNPDSKLESYGYKTETQGSDVWSVPEGYRQVQVDRWVRQCSICGEEQHTNKMEKVVIKSENKPKFD